MSVYLAEMAPPGRRGFYVSWQSASQQVAVIVAALIGVALSAVLTPAQLTAWGWRVPLAIGCAVVPLLFLLRRHLRESPGFENRAETLGFGAIARQLWTGRASIGAGMALVLMTTVSFYMITAYTPTFGKLLHLPERANLLVTAGVGASNLVWLPLMGALSDRIGRKPILIACTVLAILTAYPAMGVAHRVAQRRQARRGRAMAVGDLCQLQFGDGRVSHRDRSPFGARIGVQPGVQPGDRGRRVHPVRGDVADRPDARSGHSGRMADRRGDRQPGRDAGRATARASARGGRQMFGRAPHRPQQRVATIGLR